MLLRSGVKGVVRHDARLPNPHQHRVSYLFMFYKLRSSRARGLKGLSIGYCSSLPPRHHRLYMVNILWNNRFSCPFLPYRWITVQRCEWSGRASWIVAGWCETEKTSALFRRAVSIDPVFTCFAAKKTTFTNSVVIISFNEIYFTNITFYKISII